MKKLLFTISAVAIFLIGGCKSNQRDSQKADLIIYGGTSAAITAAVQAKKSGKSVIIVSPDKHLGGLSSGGLGFSDTGDKSVIGGLARDFYHRVYMHYQDSSAWSWQQQDEYGNQGQGTPAMDGENRTMWIFEPHVAESIFEDYVLEFGLVVHRDEWLDRERGVELEGNRIVSITTLNGKTYVGKMFIDATYEGDLMAAAGVSYHVGREARNTYNEKWNGVQTGVLHHGHWFKSDISPYRTAGDSSSGLLYGVSGEFPGNYGEADERIQAYCFRMCLSNVPQNKVPFEKPEGYDAENYELLARVFASGWSETFEKFDAIPNRKTDTNNHGPFSTDFIGMNYGYPESTYEERKEIIKAHERYQKGLMYFLANDPKVPDDVRARMSLWGLAKDEFVDNGNWPHQLYIREARRMVGQYVMTEHDTFSDKEVADPVGMGSYALDSHNVQRYVKKDGYVQNEGDIGVAPKRGAYKISYGSLIPKKEECTNLLVPVCLSSSHIAFGSIRMEPVFMILAQSAAIAASLAIDGGIDVQNVSYSDLKKELTMQKQVLAKP
ncbi:MAG: FAD-dependent oxidoreductase [Sphingobacterium sp.]|uniref:FAD-dependent oxidoreductase n=1 Tax=Sphingobacterium sp. JB170 TaxID=1434842 RepID=UPI00097EFFB9|nr:FAD-dependent oxidoreductase [Sphingobacterium sp. JB170]SJN48842.1 probable secreted protein-putative xanthan lyase related [Sphingobacterium sp. JB170]